MKKTSAQLDAEIAEVLAGTPDLGASLAALEADIAGSDFWKTAAPWRHGVVSVDHGYSDGKGRVGGVAEIVATTREDVSGVRRPALVLSLYVARNGKRYGAARGGHIVVPSVAEGARLAIAEFDRQAAHYAKTRYRGR